MAETNQNQTIFEKKIKPLFLYMGAIASVIFSIAYIIVIAVMINGLETAPTIETFTGFLIANLITGACIAISLMLQGQDFAKTLPTNKDILEKYYNKKETKLHSIKFYWVIGICKVIFIRLLMVAAMTYIVIDICWQGNGQYTYFLMALFNILMFLGFGSLGMVNMYDKFNNRHIPWVLKQLEEQIKDKEDKNVNKSKSKSKGKGKQVKKSLKKVEKDNSKQTDDSLNNNSGTDLLKPIDSDGNNGSI